mgnify:CR=1 FL=1
MIAPHSGQLGASDWFWNPSPALARTWPAPLAAGAAALTDAAAFSSTGAEVVAEAVPPPLPQVQSGPHDSAAAPTRTVAGSEPSTGPPSARSWRPSAARQGCLVMPGRSATSSWRMKAGTSSTRRCPTMTATTCRCPKR